VFTDRTRYRMLETLRAFGLDRLAAAGEERVAQQQLVRWAVGLVEWIGATLSTEREPEADAALRRELPNLRAAWRLARGAGSLDDAAAMVPPLIEAIAYRDLIEIRAWAEELADDPALATHSLAGAVLGTAASAAYHRGDYRRAHRLARAGLERAADTGASWYCVLPLASAALARGAYAEAVDVVVAEAERVPRVRDNLWLAALGAAYAGDLDRARALNERGWPARSHPRCAPGTPTPPGRSRAPPARWNRPSGTTRTPSTSPAAPVRPSWWGSRRSGCSACRPTPAGSTTRCADTER